MRRVLAWVAVALALALCYLFLLLGEPDEDSKLAQQPVQQTPITLPMSAVESPGDTSPEGLAEIFGQPVLCLYGSALSMTRSRVYDTAFQGEYARRATLTYAFEDGQSLTVESIRPVSAIALLNFFATAEGVHSYMVWGMGNFGGVSLEQLPAFSLLTVVGLLVAVMLIKPLNALLLGPRYAENLGVNIRRVRNFLLLATGLLTAVTTSFCGPISFIGLAVPHLARLMLGTSNHNSLMPVTLLAGGALALFCNLICVLPGESGVIPLNAVTPILGAPVIIYVIINQRRIQYFN